MAAWLNCWKSEKKQLKIVAYIDNIFWLMNLSSKSLVHALMQARKKIWKYGSLRNVKILNKLKKLLKKNGRKHKKYWSLQRKMLIKSNFCLIRPGHLIIDSKIVECKVLISGLILIEQGVIALDLLRIKVNRIGIQEVILNKSMIRLKQRNIPLKAAPKQWMVKRMTNTLKAVQSLIPINNQILVQAVLKKTTTLKQLTN